MFEVLKKKSRFLVDRVFIGGSVGKHTDVISPDFDCVLFINDELPLFEDVIDDFEDILLLNESLQIKEGTIKATKSSLAFTLPGGFTVDLLPAANLVPYHNNNMNVTNADLAEAQRVQVLNRIRLNPKNAQIYSSSLAEAQSEFMKTFDGFTHQLARFCKVLVQVPLLRRIRPRGQNDY